MFKLEIIEEGTGDPDIDSLGQITIGNFKEMFEVSLRDNSVQKTMAQWTEELKKLLDGAHAVAIRTQALRAWILYRHDDTVYVQDQLIVDGWGGTLGADGEIIKLPRRKTVTSDGDPISEWETTIEAIRVFCG